jgi:L-lactate dehydrogenase complex protein LldG
LPAFTGWGYSKDLPRFARKTFRARFATLSTGQVDPTPANENATAQETVTPAAGEAQPLQVTRVTQFTEELRKVNGNVIPTRKGELTRQIGAFLESGGLTHIHLEPGLLDESALQERGILISRAPDAAIRAGVTGTVCGLADTGSILIADGEGNPLTASLLPEIHIAVLCASNILPSLADALRLPAIVQAKSAVVITGPSRTADIEMSLTIGMHGPRELHVFLVDTIC